MVGASSVLSSSATPTQKKTFNTQQSSYPAGRSSFDRDGLQPPGTANSNRSAPGSSFVPRGSSLAPTPAPGSFSSADVRQAAPSRAASRMDISAAMNLERLEEDDAQVSEQKMAALRESLIREMKIKEGSENMLEALNAKKAKQTKDQRSRVEAELNSSSVRIKDLKNQIQELSRSKAPPAPPPPSRTLGLFQNSGIRSPGSAPRSVAGSEFEEETESPTYALAELLQALEVEGLTPDYYVSNANSLVDLFKRHPTLKYDLVWSIFGLRMQVMLLSESREVVAAGYRMTRHAISDLSSLQKIRSLNTDYLVILSLIKERKADVEREQALKFVRAFLEVKGGASEISVAVVRTIAAVAEHSEDRLKAICIETLAEIMIRDPPLTIAAGALKPLTDALGEGAYEASEGLVSAFLFLLDAPQRRKYLRSGYELEVLFTVFTDSSFTRERILKQNARAISAAMRSWPGLMTLSMYNFRAIRSLISSLVLPSPTIRETIIDLIFGLLRIKSPSWSTSFLAGRRLTTYGRVANLKTPPLIKTPLATTDEETSEQNMVDHYTALILAVLISAGLLPGLLRITKDTENPTMKRKTTLLIGEVLKLANKLLPSTWSGDLQLLPELFAAAAQFGDENRFVATSTVYQIDSVSRTLYRSASSTTSNAVQTALSGSSDHLNRFEEPAKSGSNISFDEATFRQMMLESQVLGSANYTKWNWEIIRKMIEGPLLNPKRLDEAMKASKFIKRIISFYRPFKYKFSECKNTRPNQVYVKVGCSLIRTLLQTSEGVRYLSDSKLLRQIAECLAQCDPSSGLIAQAPMFSPVRISETLCSGYFAIVGALSQDPKGLAMLDRWRMINMMYHIVDLKQRPDLIKLMLFHFDYSLRGHPRVLLSKSLTSGPKDVRIHSTNILRKYSSRARPNVSGGQGVGDSKWAIQMLVTQLYDPDVEVCATAIRILEEACNRKNYLEYIVQCRPALDHLGEIGAPLLLRFLSTSIGYHYLDGLDYISNEMDDWFLGRNDSYVGVIEAVLARAFSFSDPPEGLGRKSLDEDLLEPEKVDSDVSVPPHFYRELTRTQEGCKLLRDKGHFEEFAATIREYGMLTDDAELILKVKGALWAVGNVGSMELGAPFLEESDVVGYIVKIAESHEIMSLRGTAFFVLGLISRSIHGLEILSEFGWDSNTTNDGESLGLCIPTSLYKLFSFTPWKHHKISDVLHSEAEIAEIAASKKDDDPVNQRILELVSDLGNQVLWKKTTSELMQIKQRKPPGFKQPQLFKKVMKILECHHFVLYIRRFVFELFDKSVMRQIVLEEESSDEDSGGSGVDVDDDDDEDDDDEDDDDDEGEILSELGSEGRTERQRSVSAVSEPLGLGLGLGLGLRLA